MKSLKHRYRFIGKDITPDTWLLDSDETQHLAKVLRLTVGDVVEVTDGSGHWVVGRVASLNARQCTIQTIQTMTEAPKNVEPQPPWRLTVCIGALKPGMVDDILPALVELGVDQVIVFLQPDSAKMRVADKALQRWQRIVVQAVKQCKRAWLPTVRVCDSASAVLQCLQVELSNRVEGCAFMLSPDADGNFLELVTSASSRTELRDVVLAIGGEKGFTPDEELSFRQAGFTPARLGGFVLRAVTAVVSACSVAAAIRQRS